MERSGGDLGEGEGRVRARGSACINLSPFSGDLIITLSSPRQHNTNGITHLEGADTGGSNT